MIPKCELEELPIQRDQINDVIWSRYGTSRHIEGTQQNDKNVETRGSCSIENLQWWW